MTSDQIVRRCPHLAVSKRVPAGSRVCEQCVAIGDSWVHLRACLSCGQVGCCDESKNRHATRHYQETAHPLVTSLEPAEHWIYCYEDEVFMPLDPLESP
jgi:uncharacterized UBP type Zn finger protein